MMGRHYEPIIICSIEGNYNNEDHKDNILT